MKLFCLLILVASMSATSVQAASIGTMDISIDWGTLSISSPLLTPSSITDPVSGVTLSASTDLFIGDENGYLGGASSYNGAGGIIPYSDANLSLETGFTGSSGSNTTYGNTSVSNTSGIYSGYAGAYRGFIYQSTGTGTVTVSVDYSLLGSVSTDNSSDYSTAGYEVLMDAVDADLWVSTYNSAFSTNGGDSVAAEIAAEAAAALDSFTFSNYNLLECFGVTACTDSVSTGSTLSVTFDVVPGTNYAFGAETTSSVYTSTVPVPAAAWLFGSGLLGLLGVSRRKKA
jgi:hypothetical protein